MEISGRIVQLLKSLYGLLEAPKLWYEKLYQAIQKIIFERLTSIYYLFNSLRTDRAFLVVYVDDLLVIGPQKFDKKVKEVLAKLFILTDLRTWSNFLQIGILKSQGDILLSQKAYIERILEKKNMSDAKHALCTLPLPYPPYEERDPIPDMPTE